MHSPHGEGSWPAARAVRPFSQVEKGQGAEGLRRLLHFDAFALNHGVNACADIAPLCYHLSEPPVFWSLRRCLFDACLP